MAPDPTLLARILLPSPEATEALARQVADHLSPGDTILIDGPIGAGKSLFCRAAIRHMMAVDGLVEDVPSPTYTLVQTYLLGRGEVWHSDLYRLTDPSQVVELGLEDAFGAAIVLVEWPDRLGALAPQDALRITLSPGATPDARLAELRGPGAHWHKLATVLAAFAESRVDG